MGKPPGKGLEGWVIGLATRICESSSKFVTVGTIKEGFENSGTDRFGGLTGAGDTPAPWPNLH